MNFIIVALINFIDDEEKCFCIFLYFIDNIELKMIYLQKTPDYLIKLYQLKYFIKEYFPMFKAKITSTLKNKSNKSRYFF